MAANVIPNPDVLSPSLRIVYNLVNSALKLDNLLKKKLIDELFSMGHLDEDLFDTVAQGFIDNVVNNRKFALRCLWKNCGQYFQSDFDEIGQATGDGEDSSKSRLRHIQSVHLKRQKGIENKLCEWERCNKIVPAATLRSHSHVHDRFPNYLCECGALFRRPQAKTNHKRAGRCRPRENAAVHYNPSEDTLINTNTYNFGQDTFDFSLLRHPENLTMENASNAAEYIANQIEISNASDTFLSDPEQVFSSDDETMAMFSLIWNMDGINEISSSDSITPTPSPLAFTPDVSLEQFDSGTNLPVAQMKVMDSDVLRKRKEFVDQVKELITTQVLLRRLLHSGKIQVKTE